MAKTLVGGGNNGSGTATSTASQTLFAGIGTAQLSFNSTTEADGQTKWVDAGTFTQLSASVITNARTTATTLQFRVGSGNGAELVSVGAGLTGFFTDTTDSDVTSAGALVDYAQVTGTGAGNFLCNAISNVFDGGLNFGAAMTSTLWSGGGALYGRGTVFYAPAGDLGNGVGQNGSTTENAGLATRVKAFSLSSFYIRIVTNTLNQSCTPRVRVGLANGNSQVSVATGLTGTFTDTTDTDSVANNALLDYTITSSATLGTLGSIVAMGVWQEFPAGAKQNFACAQQVNTTTGGAGTDNFIPLMGTPVFTATELNAQMRVGATFNWANLRIITQTNPTATITYKSRIGGANGNQSVSIANGLHGTFEDTSDVDFLVAGNLICTDINLGASAAIQYNVVTSQFGGQPFQAKQFNWAST